MTIIECREACNKFLVGSRVIVKKRERMEQKTIRTIRTPAKVIGRYSHILTVQYRNGLTESFSYVDIVINGMLELV